MNWRYDEKHWRTRDGRVIEIAAMDPAHARAAKNYLLRNARAYVATDALETEGYAASYDGGGQMAQDRLEREADQLWRASATIKGSVDAVKQYPVFRALKSRARKDRRAGTDMSA